MPPQITYNFGNINIFFNGNSKEYTQDISCQKDVEMILTQSLEGLGQDPAGTSQARRNAEATGGGRRAPVID